MRMPHVDNQPAIEKAIDPDLVLEIELWCGDYGTLMTEVDALTQFNIGVYQIGTAVRADSRMIEPVGAAILHVITAMERYSLGISCLVPAKFSDFKGSFSPEKALNEITIVTQQLFYRKCAPIGSYRRNRIGDNKLMQSGANLVSQITGLIQSSLIPEALVTAADILLVKAYKE